MASKRKNICQLDSIELVLGAGGIKGFGHIGLLRAIIRYSIIISRMTGISIGSVMAAFASNGFTPEEILAIFLDPKMRNRSQVSLWSALKPWNLLGVGIVDIKPMMEELVREFNLKPNERLQILAYDAMRLEPVLFKGTDYDLATALSASCAVPMMMKPVLARLPEHDQSRHRTILVDGGTHHTHPVKFCQGPAIVSKLGFASQLPSEFLWPADLVLHMVEVFYSRVLDWWFDDPTGNDHLVIPVGKPNVAGLTFGISTQTCLDMVDYGDQIASSHLQDAVRRGRLPLKNHTKA